MRKGIILLAASFCFAAASAEIYNYLTISQEGKTLSIPLDKIESVTFTVEDLTTPEDVPGADYELRILTFEDADYLGDGNYLGFKDWSSLIDSPQYGGKLLYGDFDGTPYRWYDQNNTELFAAIDPDDEGLVYWNGGEAVSNYVDNSYAEEQLDNNVQLSTPTGGNSGSKNFCVHNGYFDGIFYDKPSGGIAFHDGVARVIDHLYVSLTSYGLSVGMLGNRFCDAATPEDWVTIVAIGTDANGDTKELELTLCENGKFKTDWQRWNLSELGEVTRLDFNVKSSMAGEYGMNFPAYFAYDDIAVRFPKN